jgi:hypothetical protein
MPRIELSVENRISRHLAAIRIMSCMVYPDSPELRAASEIGSASPKPPCRATCRRQADGRDSRGGRSFAIKPVRSASIPRSGPTDMLARKVRPIRLISCNPRLRELLWANNSPP